MGELSEGKAQEGPAVKLLGHRAQARSVPDGAFAGGAAPRKTAGAVGDALAEHRQQMEVLVAANEARHPFSAQRLHDGGPLDPETDGIELQAIDVVPMGIARENRRWRQPGETAQGRIELRRRPLPLRDPTVEMLELDRRDGRLDLAESEVEAEQVREILGPWMCLW